MAGSSLRRLTMRSRCVQTAAAFWYQQILGGGVFGAIPIGTIALLWWMGLKLQESGETVMGALRHQQFSKDAIYAQPQRPIASPSIHTSNVRSCLQMSCATTSFHMSEVSAESGAVLVWDKSGLSWTGVAGRAAFCRVHRPTSMKSAWMLRAIRKRHRAGAVACFDVPPRIYEDYLGFYSH